MKEILRRIAAYVYQDLWDHKVCGKPVPYMGTTIPEHLVTIFFPFAFAIIFGILFTILLFMAVK